ncbi:MAG TPA: amino acid ABC transporter substrate-binding protein [Streptosporangiaceae bacterium]|nr:amino acid ABC transporter substrate-binding protein [Streptosporangiaceae bacterium]
MPLTGPLAGFGYFEKWGYQHAVNGVNAAGGITIGGVKRKVKLILLDDQTNPNTTVNNVQRLITQDHVNALLGSCTDSLVEPGALIANRMGVPMVTPCAAVNTFGVTAKWKWAWDLFFNSAQLTETPFNTADALGLKAKTNSKVAIIHSNGKNENIMGGQEWPAWAKKHGWTVAYNQPFPPDQSQFTSALQAVKASGADMLLVVLPPPAAIALRKQMVSVGYTPKILVIEEGGEPLQFATAPGKLANGVMVGGYWDPSFPYPGANQIRKEFEVQTHQTFSQHIADTDAAAQVLLDAIKRAGSLDPTKINDQIAKTNTMTVVGHIQFGPEHTSTLPMVEEQWQNGKNVVIWPQNRATAKVLFPLP